MPLLRAWVKVLLCLVALDLLLFRIGLLWNLHPDFGPGLGGENWRFLFAAARDFETERPAVGKTEAVGSSIVVFGVNENLVNARLQHAGVPPLVRLVTHGSTATDSALMVWNSLPAHPWLVVYGTASRDYPKTGPTDSSVVRTFYDASVELPAVPRHGTEAQLEAYVKRYWKLYRYRFFARTAVETLGAHLAVDLGLPRPSFAVGMVPAPPVLPPEALRYFSPFRITPPTYAAWDKWRHSRQFDDYVAWLRLSSRSLSLYAGQTMATYGPDGNPQFASLRWMLQFLQQRQTRTVLIYFPENPVFHDPAAKPYFDQALSRADAELFAREAAAFGARFVDLRDFVEPEGFYDMIHLNLVGERKVSERIADIIEEEWRAHERHSGGAGGR
jgi:hypothetical protein